MMPELKTLAHATGRTLEIFTFRNTFMLTKL